MRKLSIIGIAISMIFILSACSGQAQAETNPTTAMETTVSETTTEAETTEVMTSSESGFNKEVYELLKLNWMNFLYTDENELRREAESMLQMEPGDENLEIIIQELLSLDRGQNPSQETTQSESLSETQTSQSQAEAPEPTQAVEPTKSVENKSTEPAPTQPVNTGDTGDTGAVMSKEEADAIWDQAAKDLGMGEKVDPSTKVEIADGPLTWDPEAAEGWNWN